MQFSEVIGQQEARDRLLRLAADGRVPHAMMFTGPKGRGKMALALAFACYLLGERMGDLPSTCLSRRWPTPRPCWPNGSIQTCISRFP